MYDVIQHASTVIPRREVVLDGSVTTEDVTEGVWFNTQGTRADGASDSYNVFPNFTAGNRTDVQELDQITVIFGPHQANTDQFVNSPTGTSYAAGQELVITDGAHPSGAGLLTPHDDGDLAAGADTVVASVTEAPADNDNLLELYRV